MTEKQIRQKLMKIVPRHIISFYPIETKNTTLGFPDLYFAGHQKSGVLELKIASGKHKIRVPYRPGQRSFLYQHSKLNRRTFVLVFYEDIYYLLGPGKNYPSEYENRAELTSSALWFSSHISLSLINTLLG